jgi:hypothetical protein
VPPWDPSDGAIALQNALFIGLLLRRPALAVQLAVHSLSRAAGEIVVERAGSSASPV